MIGGSWQHTSHKILELVFNLFRPTENMPRGTEAPCGFPRLGSLSISHYCSLLVRTENSMGAEA